MTIDRRMLGVTMLVIGALLFFYGALASERPSQPEGVARLVSPTDRERSQLLRWGGVALVATGGVFLIMQPSRG